MLVASFNVAETRLGCLRPMQLELAGQRYPPSPARPPARPSTVTVMSGVGTAVAIGEVTDVVVVLGRRNA